MMLGRRFMACKRRAQGVAVIGDNFMLPSGPAALWSYAWRSSVSERRRSSQGWASSNPFSFECSLGGILAGQGEARAVIAGEEPINSNNQKGWPPFCGLRASS